MDTYLDGGKIPSNGLAMALGCASYAHYVDADVAPEAAAIQVSLDFLNILMHDKSYDNNSDFRLKYSPIESLSRRFTVRRPTKYAPRPWLDS